MSDSLCQGVMPEDSLALGDKMVVGLKAAYEALQRNIVAQRRVLEDRLKQTERLLGVQAV
ncbi:hypothetical protein GBAR_LOCUS16704 [Geodia barretti]|uniref:Uncharacterized protein n=1 Tax=Geodia barretti TaxID=519541 RepID=A0AA35SHT6_GEOBA|nr:hypothetical protein GBAR_LOCUS16704 [Geodia barretti]